QMGNRQGVLELLRLVQIAGAALMLVDKAHPGSSFHSETATAERMVMLDGGPTAETHVIGIGAGCMIAYTCRSPDKDTDNEDTVAAMPYGPDAAVLVVADGAGGLPAGRRASRTAVATLEASLQTSISDTTLLRTAILNGIDEANRAVLELGGGSATTLTVV